MTANDAERGRQLIASRKYATNGDEPAWPADDPGPTEPPADDDLPDDPDRDDAQQAAEEEIRWPKWLKCKPFRDQLLSVTDLSRLPAVEPLVDGLLFRNTVAQLCGPPGSYKSFISVNLSCALASGQGHWEGHRIPVREKVIYVAAEGATGLLVRTLAWCERNHVNPDELDGWLHFLPLAIQLGNKVDVANAAAMASDVGAGLLVLDTRARCTLGLEENSATEQGEAVDAADYIRAAADCTTLAVHHTGRAGLHPRGSTAWDGAVWSDLRLTADNHAGTVAIKVEKHKDAPSGKVFDYRLMPHTVSESLMPGVPEESRKSLVGFSFCDENRSEILTRIENLVREIAENSCGLEGLPRTRLVALSVEADIPESSAYRAINALIARGYLHNVGTEKRCRYIYSGSMLGD